MALAVGGCLAGPSSHAPVESTPAGDPATGDADEQGDGAAGDDAAPADAAAGDSDATGDTGPLTELPIRVPEVRATPIVGGPGGESPVADVDHVCHIAYGALELDLYVRASGDYVDFDLRDTVFMKVVGAWAKQGETVTPIAAAYDLGGTTGSTCCSSRSGKRSTSCGIRPSP